MPYKDLEKRREYNRNYHKRRYAEDPKYREDLTKRVRERQKQARDWYREYKKDLKCEHCGEDHPACISFHHVDPSNKEINISHAALKRRWTTDRILKEIEKCIVLCLNCHAKVHHRKE